MERKWTSEQRDAIYARGGTLLVSAAAGSGKTAVLVERVIGLITDPNHPCDADRLLVVTFTNAAAAEMRERISQRLSDMISQNPLDFNLQRQQMLLQNGHISTIHSFCLDLLREHFEKLDIPPDFRVADQNESEIIRSEVLSDILEKMYAEGGEAFLELSRVLSTGRGDKALSDTVLRLYDFMRSLDDADGFLKSAAAMYDETKPVENSVWGRIAIEYTKAALGSALNAHRRALLKIHGDPQLDKAYGPAFESDIAGIERLIEKAESGDWDGLCSAVSGFSFERLGALRKFGDEALKEELKAQRDSLKKLLSELSSGVLCSSAADFKSDMRRLRPLVECMCDILKKLDREFFKEKLSRGILDFSDLEQLTLKLLIKREDGKVVFTNTAREIASRFDEILVDEYQDTNPAQDMIFRAVSRNETNLFMVGDVKQSIYSFRQARPELFTGMSERCTPFDGVNFPARIILGRNFRSRKGVTDAVNFTFEKLMSKELGGVDYGENEKLTPAATYFERGGADFAIHLIDAGEYDGDEDGAEIEARHIAREIKRLIAEGFTVQGEKGPRKVTYRDFSILLRSMEGRAQKYVRVLENEGIPVYADIASGYLGAYEVMVALSLLRIIDNPLQDVPLVSVLLSPVFGFTPDDIALVRLKAKDKSLYLALLEFAKEDTRFDGFLRLLDRLRTLAAVLPADRLILRIYDETGMLNIFEAMPNGEMRHANLRLLLDYARAYESAGWRGLSGFMNFIDRVDRQNSDIAPASSISENADVVRIMSIHKSKGLEFPICFLGGLSKRFNNEDIQKPVLFHPYCGLGSMVRDNRLNCRFTTLPREAARIEIQKSSLSEEMRVLYVAMTRAKEKLYAVMTLKNAETALRRAASIMRSGEKVSYFEAMSAQCPAELLLAAALVHPSCGKLRSLAGVYDAPVKDSGGIWEFEWIDARSLVSADSANEKADNEIYKTAETERLKNEIKARIEYKYPYENLLKLPTKVSVSELTEKQGTDFSAENVRPSFLEGEGLSPAEKGTALHAFMQYCRLDALRSESGAAEEVERLVEEKFILPEQGAAVDTAKAAAFGSSPVYKRICAAKKLWREFRFNIEVPANEIYEEAADTDAKILLQGMADLVFEEDGGAVILDYKTDRVSSPEALIERYSGQLNSYARAVQEILGVPVKEKIIYSFQLEREIRV